MNDGITITRIDPRTPERFQPLRRELGVTTFGINHILLQPGQRGRIHLHERQEEVYMVLDGRLTLIVEGEEQDLERGQAVRIAPSLRRQLVNRGPGPVSILALGAATPHSGRDGVAFASWDAADGASPQETPLPPDLPAEELRAR